MSLSFEIRNQIIQCIGLCFHFKDNVEAFFLACNIDRRLVRKYKDSPKFIWARNILNELDTMENGLLLQRRLVTELCKFRSLPDNNVPNPDAGLDALRKIKELALANKIEIEEKKSNFKHRNQLAQEKLRITQERSAILSELRLEFISSLNNENRQSAGYTLEDILERLFPIFDLEYRKSYKTNTQQIDGHFKFEGFDYLVEAKWRKDQPNENEIGGFKRKIDTKLESTRGLFISINGVREEVIRSFEGNGNNIIFLSGEDFIHILEGRIALDEVLRKKIDKAAQEGIAYFPVSTMMSSSDVG